MVLVQIPFKHGVSARFELINSSPEKQRGADIGRDLHQARMILHDRSGKVVAEVLSDSFSFRSGPVGSFIVKEAHFERVDPDTLYEGVQLLMLELSIDEPGMRNPYSDLAVFPIPQQVYSDCFEAG